MDIDIDNRLVGACFRAKSDNLLIRLYCCSGSKTGILIGEHKITTLIESNIESAIYDFIKSAETYELTETKRLVKGTDAENPFYEITQLDYRSARGISKRRLSAR